MVGENLYESSVEGASESFKVCVVVLIPLSAGVFF